MLLILPVREPRNHCWRNSDTWDILPPSPPDLFLLSKVDCTRVLWHLVNELHLFRSSYCWIQSRICVCVGGGESVDLMRNITCWSSFFFFLLLRGERENTEALSNQGKEAPSPDGEMKRRKAGKGRWMNRMNLTSSDAAVGTQTVLPTSSNKIYAISLKEMPAFKLC